MRRILSFAAALVLLMSRVGEAQDRPPSPTADQPVASQTAVRAFEVDKLPISIERIQKKLATLPSATNISGIKLEYYIQVYGTAPRVDFFTSFNTLSGPVPMSGPTHRDILEVVTPQEFRPPVMDLNALAAWLRGKSSR